MGAQTVGRQEFAGEHVSAAGSRDGLQDLPLVEGQPFQALLKCGVSWSTMIAMAFPMSRSVTRSVFPAHESHSW
jgi:hypothetical protein